MQKHTPPYLIGIDLGTTHTVVAFAKFEAKQDIRLFEIDQLAAPGQTVAKPLLPSVRYHPAENELSESDLIFSQPGTRAVIGEAARLLGSKSKGRLVTSAKSWLSHPAIDQDAGILPWGSDEGVEKVSPVEASASYLRHIRTVWHHRFPDAPLENQDVVITVPASFDEAARSLTLDAAKRAGLHQVKLLEEPQAVCYDWLRRHANNITGALSGVRLLLVCDVGGGTTDLTLIKVDHTHPEPKLTRVAVGDHLMLGGDNIDLALAHFVENRLNDGQTRLSASDLYQLIEQCRTAKERLLAEDAPGQLTVTLLGSGSKLIGSSRSTTITKDEVRRVALDGFFPISSLDELPDKKRSGVVEFGLPYTAEPAVTKHIAAFLQMHKETISEALGGDGIVPDAILLNGGLFRSPAITQRMLAIFRSWKSRDLILLENNCPEFSVAYGAVSYAVARRDKKLVIHGGSARSYFLSVDSDDNNRKTANRQSAKQGICVLPKGSNEGEEIILPNRRFALLTGRPVQFELVSYSGDMNVKVGEIVEINDDFHALPPLIASFNDDSRQGSADVIVELGVTHTGLGTLKIQCIAVNGTSVGNEQQANHNRQRWNVEFQIRKHGTAPTRYDAELSPQLNKAVEHIQAVFGPKSKDIDPNAVKYLRADLEKSLGKGRPEWDSSLLRPLFTALLEGQKYRRRSEHHERVWLSLTGFCLRPGFGCPLDDWRVEQLSKIYPQGIQFANEIQNWSEWWILWRRIAGGLGVDFQQKLYDDIANYINPASARQPSVAKLAKQRSLEDIIRLAAVLERMPAQQKIQLGEWLLKRLEKSGEPQQTWWALGRVGTRTPFYGSSHNVVSADIAGNWLKKMLALDWKKNPQVAFAAAMVSRKCGDRARDIDENLRIKILDKLKTSKCPLPWISMVGQFMELDEKEENQFFGEALPPGLKLIHNAH